MSAPEAPVTRSCSTCRGESTVLIRSLRLIVLSLLVIVPLCVRAEEPRKVTIVVDWIPDQPHHFAYWLAKSHGWYAENGLDVTIQGSRGSNLVIQLVVAGKAEFGNIAASALVQGVAKQDVPLKMVGVYFQKDITAMAYFESSGIKSLKDFEGKSMGIVPGTLQYVLWPIFAKTVSIDASKVRFINSDFQLIMTQFGAKRFDVLGNFLVGTTDSLRFSELGETLHPVVLSDYLPLIGHGIVTSTALIEKEPQTVQGFVKATQKAWAYMAQQPVEATEEAGRIIAANVENVPPAAMLAKYAREAIPSRLISPSTSGKPLGWSSDADWEKMVDVLTSTGDYPRKPKVDELMTNKFVEP